MSKANVYFLVAIVSALLQVTFLEAFRFLGIKPDLIFMIMVIGGMNLKSRQAYKLAIFCGMLKDLFSINIFAINTLFYTASCFLLKKLSTKIQMENIFLRSSFILLLVLLQDIAMRIIFLFRGNFINWGFFLRQAFLDSLYTAIAFFFIFNLLHRLKDEN